MNTEARLNLGLIGIMAAGMILGAGAALLGIRSPKADRLARHCDLMRLTLDAELVDVDAPNPMLRDAAVLRFQDLGLDNFRVIRLCTDETPFDFCVADATPACVHRSIATIRQAWER